MNATKQNLLSRSAVNVSLTSCTIKCPIKKTNFRKCIRLRCSYDLLAVKMLSYYLIHLGGMPPQAPQPGYGYPMPTQGKHLFSVHSFRMIC